MPTPPQKFGQMTTRLILLLLASLLSTSCSHYTREMFRENKLTPATMQTPRHHPDPRHWDDRHITYSWLGHATVLINLMGSWIMTDPVLHKRIGPPEVLDNLLGIKRITALPLTIDALPAIDIALISHAHYDHLDLPSLRTLEPMGTHLIVPRQVATLADMFDTPVTELDWLPGERAAITLDDGLTICAFRVEHYGYVPFGKRHRPMGFNGYLLEKRGIRIAFLGDTSFDRNRDENGRLLRQPVKVDWSEKLNPGTPPDLCILPIGDSYYHLNHTSPAEALAIANAMNCRKLLPIHYGTFRLTPRSKARQAPELELFQLLKKRSDEARILCGKHQFPEVGVTCQLPAAKPP